MSNLRYCEKCQKGYLAEEGHSCPTSEDEAKFKRSMDLMHKGLSSCCEAPFDTSQVIKGGKYKNHGPRFCSKCRKLCFMV
jgi:hypothetical protein